MKKIKIGIRNLSEILYKNGHIESGFFRKAEASDGRNNQKKIQKDRGEDYQTEVHIIREVFIDETMLTLSGRIDGVEKVKDNYILEEIKTTESFDENKKIEYMSQLKIYGYIFSCDKELEFIDLRLVVTDIDLTKIQKFEYNYSFIELQKFFYETIKSYYYLFNKTWKKYEENKNLVKTAPFPYSSFRKGQRECSAFIYRSIRAKVQGVLEAPTGIGKTPASIFSFIKYSSNDFKRAVFLTARNTGRKNIRKSIEFFNTKNLPFFTVFIISKKEICVNDVQICNPDHCPYASDYNNKLREVLPLFSQQMIYDKEDIEKLALKYKICPFELSLDLSLFADLTVCDYNYVYDPIIQFKRLYDRAVETVLIVDEAHNLFSRTVDMYSGVISSDSIEVLRKYFIKKSKSVYSQLLKLKKAITSLHCDMIKEFSDDKFYKIISDYDYEINKLSDYFVRKAIKYFIESDNFPDQEIVEAIFEFFAFNIRSGFTESSTKVITEKKGKNFTFETYNPDPSEIIKKINDSFYSTIMMSATAFPLNSFSVVSGLTSPKFYSSEYPFPVENLNVKAIPIDVRYSNRSNSLDSINHIIGKSGKSIVFFSSFSYMNQYLTKYPAIDNDLVQFSGMDEGTRNEYFNKVTEHNFNNIYAVFGGIFSEGIDLNGIVDSIIIIGVGYGAPDFRSELRKEAYNTRDLNGNSIVYIEPGIKKVIQAVGRGIRSDHDKCNVILIDSRYYKFSFKKLLPKHWKL
ncbi:MAG: ATP-dependent DNA helicase [Candidatus Delongbacteria bacterium]|nr:ATP-dependent DNA helicase [Candidatus Delongbacteria bacterium]MBN2836842.1 ATP-dependent DNA helicase [Candidatus Delongbacteria bacterium]